MKKILTNYRYYVITLLCGIVIIGLFAVPAEDLPLAYWFYVLVSTKLIALAAGSLLAYLLKRWEAKGTIPELVDAKKNY